MSHTPDDTAGERQAHAWNIRYLPEAPVPFVIHFVSQYRWAYLAILLLQITAVVCTVLIPWSLGQVTRLVNANGTTDALFWPVAGFAVLVALEVVFTRSANTINIRVLPRQRARVTHTVYAYLQQHSHRFVSNEFAGALAHKVSEVAMGVNQTMNILLFDLIPLLVTLSLASLVLASASGLLAAFMLGWSVLFIGVSFLLARRSHPLAQQYSAARSISTGKVVDAVTNLSNVRLFARHSHELDYLSGYLDRELAAAGRSLGYMEKIRWFQNSCGMALKIGMLLLTLWLWRSGAISIAAFVMATSMALLIINDVASLSRRFLELFEATGNIANGVRTLIRPHEVVDSPDARRLEVHQGSVEFRGVRFGYHPGQPIFEQLDLRIPAGQRIGLVGFSGSGKSTLLNLLLRLYDVDGGQVLIDGQDIREVTQHSLHRQIGLIPQEPGLFHRSIRENIHYGRLEASAEELAAAIHGAGASAFIERMEHGYDSLVGERGVKLSGGQRQRIAIARVLLKNAPILVMDEATSSLDSITERFIQDQLDSIMQGKTVIVVAHRLSTVAHLDRIIVFDKGRVVEDGSHQELLKKRGQYYRLWSRQSDGLFQEEAEAV
ncbi:ATP-binding cassette, subfamily B [Pseudomonas citronellolis]|uniref:ATP-binding cassette, subfamily B n=1 Tax=Pseudomonas citronellolis TaxID=53408 RepID=A0AAQ1HLF5_9PSED|nr:ABC transporter ATP-binding protein [Pseudomonas citronellolis]MCP1645371.1 ATP-binding cassette subfamily B protein [Pseudomonas citronellolis]MCP1668760.1 ATP-binding cassette subfamily B protein [Pseudomonas citronellolis]MCP1699749.1 ATP-binding cassette subfamily B protein [Pseudomonas citronellolis]MCP1703751.1 ATP-binding cassette subfamily B protein [Pseudomonas citronellolis]MCP1800427.1 ATP-binding cassette subfamily B protein [Pseudomonas citronellolis]